MLSTSGGCNDRDWRGEQLQYDENCTKSAPGIVRNTYFIQTKEDLEHTDFSRFDYVGITAGASTPNNIIEEVQKYVRNEL